MKNGAEWRADEAPAAIVVAGGEGQRFRRPSSRRACSRTGLWNSFIVVARPAALLRLIGSAAPALLAAFEPGRGRIGTQWEKPAVCSTDATLASVDFSKDVLERGLELLAVLPIHDVGWRAPGEPRRMAAWQRKFQWQPALV